MQARLDETDDKCIRLLIEGKLDLLGSEQLESLVSDVLGRKRPKLVVDLSGATFVNTPGWAVLINYQNEAAAFGGTIELTGLRGSVRDSFEIAGIEGLLPVAET